MVGSDALVQAARQMYWRGELTVEQLNSIEMSNDRVPPEHRFSTIIIRQ